MFGNLGGFVNGNIFCGLFGSDIGVRLTDAEDRSRLVEPVAARLAVPSGRWAGT